MSISQSNLNSIVYLDEDCGDGDVVSFSVLVLLTRTNLSVSLRTFIRHLRTLVTELSEADVQGN